MAEGRGGAAVEGPPPARRQLRVGKTIDASCPALASLLRSRLAPLPAAQVRSCNTAGLSVQGRSALSATYDLLLLELSIHMFHNVQLRCFKLNFQLKCSLSSLQLIVLLWHPKCTPFFGPENSSPQIGVPMFICPQLSLQLNVPMFSIEHPAQCSQLLSCRSPR